MAGGNEKSPTLLNDLIKSGAQALIPTLLLAIFTFVISFLVPENEIRVIPSLVDGRSFFLTVENHNKYSLGPISLSIQGTHDLKLLSQDAFVEVDSKSMVNGNASMLTLSKISPLRRTVLLFSSSNTIQDGTVSILNAPSNVRIVKGEDLESNAISSISLAPILLQSLVFFCFFLAFNYARRRTEQDLEKANSKADDLGKRIDLQEVKNEKAIDKFHQEINAIRSVYKKNRIYTRQIYENIHNENRMWRRIFIESVSSLMKENRRNSLEMLRPLLRRAGIKRLENLEDVDLEVFLHAMEASEIAPLEQADERLPTT